MLDTYMRSLISATRGATLDRSVRLMRAYIWLAWLRGRHTAAVRDRAGRN